MHQKTSKFSVWYERWVQLDRTKKQEELASLSQKIKKLDADIQLYKKVDNRYYVIAYSERRIGTVLDLECVKKGLKNLPVIDTTDINEKVFKNLKNLPLLKTVEIDKNNLKITTKNLAVKFKNKKHNIGCYGITIPVNLDNYDIRKNLEIENKTYTGDNGKPHPHMFRGDGTCFGDFTNEIREGITGRDIVATINNVISFIYMSFGSHGEDDIGTYNYAGWLRTKRLIQ